MSERTERPREDDETGAGTGTAGTGRGGAGGVAPSAEGTVSATGDTRPAPDARPDSRADARRRTGEDDERRLDDVGGRGGPEAGMAGSGMAAPPDDYPVGPDAGTTGGA